MNKIPMISITFWAKFLLAFIFISKLGLANIFPNIDRVLPIIFQGGLHPYVNLVLNFVIGIPILWVFFSKKKNGLIDPHYKILMTCILAILIFQNALRILLMPEQVSLVFATGSLIGAGLLMGVYGYAIPQLISIEDFFNFIKKVSTIFLLMSCLIIFVRGDFAFKGTRLIGIFKHIPYMVTCANLTCILSLGSLFYCKQRLEKWISLFLLTIGFILLLLTGTRSAISSVFIAGLLFFLLSKPQNISGHYLRFSTLIVFLFMGLIFMFPFFQYISELLTGVKALGFRSGQNGIESRIEEVLRGWRMFQQNPWIGHGLLSKFSSGAEFNLQSYNSFKDPHNIFVSAGVVGGWPLMALSMASIIMLVFGSLRNVIFGCVYREIIGVYVISHLPILLIYHVHLSVGGMADRLYWLLFGYLALTKK